MTQDELFDGGKADFHSARPDVYVTEACLDNHAVQLLGIRHHPIGAILRCSLQVHVPFKSVTNGGVVWARRSPDAEKQPSARYENAMHLTERRALVWKKLKTLLAQEDVDGGILEFHGHRTPLDPNDGRTSGSR